MRPLVIALLLVSISAVVQAAAPAGYSLVWRDEFSGSKVNESKWTFDLGTGCETPTTCGWGNAELEYYTKKNAVVSGGKLIITAKEESVGGASFTSARLKTMGKMDFTFGYVEAKLMLPRGLGVWPAFWMLPGNSPYGTWAASGEIDILEVRNREPVIFETIHYGASWPNNRYRGNSTAFTAADAAVPHIFALEWTSDRLKWFLDDILITEYTEDQWNSTGAPDGSGAPFNIPFHVVLNLAVGGAFTGSPSAAAIKADWATAGLVPALEVDYVRVYSADPMATVLPRAVAVPGTVNAGADFVNLVDLYFGSGYPNGGPRSGSGLVNVFGLESYTYILDVSSTASFGVTYTLASGAAFGAPCLAGVAGNETPVRLFLVKGSDCNGARFGLLDRTGDNNRVADGGTYQTYAASSPISWTSTGRQTVTLCVEQGPFLKISQLGFALGGPAVPHYPYKLPGVINGADFGFSTFVEGYKGACGPRFDKNMGEISAGESYTYDLAVTAPGSYNAVYRLTTGKDTGVLVSLYTTVGTDCSGIRYNTLQISSSFTGGYANFTDFPATGALPFPTKGRTKVTLCVENGSYMLLASIRFTKA